MYRRQGNQPVRKTVRLIQSFFVLSGGWMSSDETVNRHWESRGIINDHRTFECICYFCSEGERIQRGYCPETWASLVAMAARATCRTCLRHRREISNRLRTVRRGKKERRIDVKTTSPLLFLRRHLHKNPTAIMWAEPGGRHRQRFCSVVC